MTIESSVITPDWDVSNRVRACMTTRLGGVSSDKFAALNLGDHVQDVPSAVEQNRLLLQRDLQLPSEPVWLNQVHGDQVIRLPINQHRPEADAAWTDQAGQVCVVMTADCLPILLADRLGRCVAAIHGGWRSLVAGIITRTVNALPVESLNLQAWLGAGIGPCHFEIGPEVRDTFLTQAPDLEAAFVAGEGDRWLADIYVIARHQLHACGVEPVFGGGLCTHCDDTRFYSFRRDGQTGRMAAMIWMEQE